MGRHVWHVVTANECNPHPRTKACTARCRSIGEIVSKSPSMHPAVQAPCSLRSLDSQGSLLLLCAKPKVNMRRAIQARSSWSRICSTAADPVPGAHRLTSPSVGSLRLVTAGLLVALFSTGCCARNVVIRRSPGASTGVLGPLQRCAPGQQTCAPDPTYNTSIYNSSNTTYFSFPSCDYGIDQLMVQDSGSAKSVVVVQCAAPGQAPPVPGGGMPTTAPGGGTTPSH